VVKWTAEVLPQAVKPAVARRYKSSIQNLEVIMGSLKIEQIDGAKVAEFVSSRAGKVSNATIRRDLTALSRLLAACQAWGWIAANPARTYDRSAVLRERRDPITPPTQEAFDMVLEEATHAMAQTLRLLVATGMRAQEAVKLEAEDLDRTRQIITLTRTKTSKPRTLKWKTPGGDAEPILACAPEKGELFPTNHKESYKNFSSAFGGLCRRIAAKAKKEKKPFRRFRVHDLRHLFAIRWLRAGGDIYTLSKHLGHTSVRTTEIYLGYLEAEEHAGAQSGAQAGKSEALADIKKAI